MQQFLLNEKVICEVHMKSIDLKQRTRYAKKYDMPTSKPTQPFTARNIIQSLLEKQRKVLTKTKIDEVVTQNSPKTKHLLSTLRTDQIFLTSDDTETERKTFIKDNCFKVKGLKKDAKDTTSSKKSINRTCSLVSAARYTECHVAPYDVNSDIRFKRSPRCFISPKAKPSSKKGLRKLHTIESKQNISPQQKTQSNHLNQKPNQTTSKLTIKQMVDKQIEQQIKKRRAICRTAPTKHLQRMNVRQQLSQDYGFMDEDICKVEAKIYSEMRENRQKAQRRNKERIGINITKNKPFSSVEINKCTVKLLKKYNCDNMVYFSKFTTKE